MLALVDWTMAVPVSLPVISTVAPNVDSVVNGDGKNSNRKASVLAGVFSVLEHVFSPSVSLPSTQNAEFVPGCPFGDPLSKCLSTTSEMKFLDEIHSSDSDSLSSPNPEALGDNFSISQDQFFPDSIRDAARCCLCHLFNNLGRYPLSSTGDLLSSIVQEHHDRTDVFSLPSSSTNPMPSVFPSTVDDLSLEAVESPNVQLFALNSSILITVLSICRDANNASNVSHDVTSPLLTEWATRTGHSVVSDILPVDVVTDQCDVRFIVRDLSGKYCWDATHVYGLPPAFEHVSPVKQSSGENYHPPPTSASSPNQSVMLNQLPPSPPPRHKPSPVRFYSGSESFSADADPQSNDFLSDLLQDLSQKMSHFPSSLQRSEDAYMSDSPFEKLASEQVSALLEDELLLRANSRLPQALPYYGFSYSRTENEERSKWNASFSQYSTCKRFLGQLGFLTYRRSDVQLLRKSAGLLRELKRLDKQRSREMHKFAVIYIGPGQERKQDILSNNRGSLEFENFVDGLGWSVDLAEHRGFLGGLDPSGQNGKTATYYATSTVEAIFHVSTRMPSSSNEDQLHMYKHLGNDDVMIIWSEHWRPFKRSSLRTEFGDVLLIITPLPNGLFRIEIRNESDAPFFGPLVDGVLVSEESLPFLVRSTVLNASRALNSIKMDFREHFDERASYLRSIINNNAKQLSFEEYTKRVMMPQIPPGVSEKTSAYLNQLQVTIPPDSQSNPLTKDTSPRSKLRLHAWRRRSVGGSLDSDVPVATDIFNSQSRLFHPGSYIDTVHPGRSANQPGRNCGGGANPNVVIHDHENSKATLLASASVPTFIVSPGQAAQANSGQSFQFSASKLSDLQPSSDYSTDPNPQHTSFSHSSRGNILNRLSFKNRRNASKLGPLSARHHQPPH